VAWRWITLLSKVDIVGLQATVDDLKQAISQANPKYYPSRQRLTLPPQTGQKSGSPLVDGKLLSEYSLSGGSKVVFKDLGTQASGLIYLPAQLAMSTDRCVSSGILQVGWTTVFFWEYFGPLAVYPLFYFLPGLLYPGVK